MSQQRRDELVSYMSVMTKRVSSREVMFQLNEFLIDSLIPRHSRETGQRANQLFEQMPGTLCSGCVFVCRNHRAVSNQPKGNHHMTWAVGNQANNTDLVNMSEKASSFRKEVNL